MPPNQQNPYDFILSNNQAPKRNPLSDIGTGMRIALVAVGVVILIMLAVIVSSILGSGDKAQTQRLTEVAQAQSEIIRISTVADKQAKSTKARNYATNSRVTATTSQQQIKKLLEKRGIKDKDFTKKLAAGKNEKNDATLDEATKNNRFDDTFMTLLDKQIADYQKLLQAAAENGSAAEKKALAGPFNSSKILVGAAENSTKQ